MEKDHLAVILENMTDRVEVVSEALEATRISLEGKIGKLGVELKNEIADLRLGVTLMDQRLTSRLDQVGSRLDRFDGEIDRLKKSGAQ